MHVYLRTHFYPFFKHKLSLFFLSRKIQKNEWKILNYNNDILQGIDDGNQVILPIYQWIKEGRERYVCLG